MGKLDNIQPYNSIISKDFCICSVNSKNIITDKRKLTEQEMMGFLFGIVKALENQYGKEFVVEDDIMKIKIEVSHRIELKLVEKVDN